MTWKRLHCIVCHSDMESCAICGCHDDVSVASIESEHDALRLDTEARKKAPAANGGRSLTPTPVEGGTAK